MSQSKTRSLRAGWKSLHVETLQASFVHRDQGLVLRQEELLGRVESNALVRQVFLDLVQAGWDKA